jgi:hypothetical protein
MGKSGRRTNEKRSPVESPPKKTKVVLVGRKAPQQKKDEESLSDYRLRLIRARMLRARATCRRDLQEVQNMLALILKEAPEGSEEWIDAGTFQATLFLQEEDTEEQQQQQQQHEAATTAVVVARLLEERGFSYRLSRQALVQSHGMPTAAPLPYANAWDNVLPQSLLEKLSQSWLAKAMESRIQKSRLFDDSDLLHANGRTH